MTAIRTMKIKSPLWKSVFLLTVSFWILSCGKKGLPTPPREVPPPGIPALSMTVEVDDVILSWTAPEGSRSVMAKLGSFFIYRSKQSLSAPECKDCPILFTRIADVPYRGEKPGAETITYVDALEKGYRYIYKVTVYSKAGLTSGDSNLVEFVH
jgi:hypothetical protein